jgi:hypothetical protein
MLAIKSDSCCRIRNKSVETSSRKILLLTLCIYVIPQSFVLLTIFDIVLNVLYIIQGYYSLVLRALLNGTGCYLIEEGMVADIIHICDISIVFQFLNVFFLLFFFIGVTSIG